MLAWKVLNSVVYMQKINQQNDIFLYCLLFFYFYYYYYFFLRITKNNNNTIITLIMLCKIVITTCTCFWIYKETPHFSHLIYCIFNTKVINLLTSKNWQGNAHVQKLLITNFFNHTVFFRVFVFFVCVCWNN